jgi:hypothetical protein
MAECTNNLCLMINIIAMVHKGMSMNPSSTAKGMGGYSDSGFAWCYYIPAGLQFQATNNLLEHLVAIITPWIDIIANHLKLGACALSMTDSTTLEGWLRKTNFSELGDNPIQATVQLEVAQMNAKNYMALGIWDYNPDKKHQKAISMSIISALAKTQISEIDRTIVQLTSLGMFFAFW